MEPGCAGSAVRALLIVTALLLGACATTAPQDPLTHLRARCMALEMMWVETPAWYACMPPVHAPDRDRT